MNSRACQGSKSKQANIKEARLLSVCVCICLWAECRRHVCVSFGVVFFMSAYLCRCECLFPCSVVCLFILVCVVVDDCSYLCVSRFPSVSTYS